MTLGVLLLSIFPPTILTSRSCACAFFTVHLLCYSHSVNETIKITVPFHLNLRQQNIKCPLYKFKAVAATSPISLITWANTIWRLRTPVPSALKLCLIKKSTTTSSATSTNKSLLPPTQPNRQPTNSFQLAPPQPPLPLHHPPATSHDRIPETHTMDPASQPPCSPTTMVSKTFPHLPNPSPHPL